MMVVLQQYLPFTVLKPTLIVFNNSIITLVATVLTVYGIETSFSSWKLFHYAEHVAIALTVYGIETRKLVSKLPWICYVLQQYLSLTVYDKKTK